MGRGVRDGVGVAVSVGVGMGVLVSVGVMVGSAVGGSPSTVNRPETFQVRPVKICTSYSPTAHAEGSGSQSVYPLPPVLPSQGWVSQ